MKPRHLPGREEYLDSEKYEIRVRRYDAPGNIVAEIAKLNRIRKNTPALQTHLGLRFYPAHNDMVILYGKPFPRARHDLVAVSLDPFHAQEVTIEVPLWEWKVPDNGAVTVQDLMRDTTSVWHGKLQRIRLDPTIPFRHLAHCAAHGARDHGRSIKSTIESRGGSALVQGCYHLSAAREIILRQQRRRDRRFPRPYFQARLYRRSRRATRCGCCHSIRRRVLDDGYDISDYRGVHPDYGTLADFRRFVREAHRRGIRVITELVVNHTSDQHPWFQRARNKARIALAGFLCLV